MLVMCHLLIEKDFRKKVTVFKTDIDQRRRVKYQIAITKEII